ncbi:hypothetical protein ACW9H6_04115 [Pseudomonas sp. SDO528_S397]
MDYPKSVPSVGLVNGKFVDENPVTGTPGSLIPASWGNGVTAEILNVLAAAGIVPDELKTDQLAQALNVLNDWSKLKNKPTTLGGYGITDALVVGTTSYQRPSLSASDLTDLGNGFGGALEIREAQQVGNTKLTFEYAPKIMFHWRNRYANTLAMNADGELIWGAKKVWSEYNFDPANKADKSTTLAGYGIVPATPAEVLARVDNTKPLTAASLAAFDPWAMQPVGVPIPIFDNIGGVAIPPTDNGLYRYIKLSASDPYNAGVLISESVTGSAPLVVASAVVNFPGSPFNARSVSLLNTERRSLRPGLGGALEQDAFQGHKAKVTGWNPYYLAGGTSLSLAAIGNGVLCDLVEDGTNGVLRQASETRIKSIGATYYMRIK